LAKLKDITTIERVISLGLEGHSIDIGAAGTAKIVDVNLVSTKARLGVWITGTELNDSMLTTARGIINDNVANGETSDENVSIDEILDLFDDGISFSHLKIVGR